LSIARQGAGAEENLTQSRKDAKVWRRRIAPRAPKESPAKGAGAEENLMQSRKDAKVWRRRITRKRD